MICIVGLLELDRAFHRREFVSFLYAQRHSEERKCCISYPLFSFLYFLFFYSSFVLCGGG